VTNLEQSFTFKFYVLGSCDHATMHYESKVKREPTRSNYDVCVTVHLI
jgi:hypothetical protein